MSSPLLATGSRRAVLFSPQFEVLWQYPAGNISDIQLLPNGNILFADSTVTEVTPDKKVVFQYKSDHKEGAYTCERLPNGNTLIGENYNGKIKEITPDGSVAFELQTKFETSNLHHRLRIVRKLPNGNYLVCHSGDHLVREYQPDGTIVWEKKVPNVAFKANRLDDGSTIISSLDQISRWDKDDHLVWEFKKDDMPELAIKNMTGFQIQPNGNILIGCYAAYDKDKEGKGVGVFEITADKKLVWALHRPTDGRTVDQSFMGVCFVNDFTLPLSEKE